MTVYTERIPSMDPRLNRHVRHDPESRRYQPDLTGLTLSGFDWPLTADPLDQGNVGACTAGASLTCLMIGPFAGNQAIGAAVAKAFGGWTQAGIYAMYNDEENLDGDGPYPPQDNGSTGLTAAKVLRANGVITGWTQTFTLNDALTAGQLQPFITGTVWFNSMFTPDAEGIVTVDPSSGVAGGHEYTVISYDPARGLVGMRNDWGAWGLNGTGVFYMPAESYGSLLDQQGDTTFFALPGQPAPTPTPPAPGPTPAPTPDPADAAFAIVLRRGDWLTDWHVGETSHVRDAAATWLREKNL